MGEVDELRATVFGHHVGRLQIEVQDAFGVQVAQGTREVRAEVGELGAAQWPAPVGDQVLDGLPRQRLHHDRGPGASWTS